MFNLDGTPLSITQVVEIARGTERVALHDAARNRMQPSVELIEEINAGSAPVYGVTTGFGALADKLIAFGDRATLQSGIVQSHAAGMGQPLDREIVRGLLLLRARSLAAGHSGVRPRLVDALLELLNDGPLPEVPEYGSLGASGDLATLAHATRPVLQKIELQSKEGLSLINGTDAMTTVLALAVHDLTDLLTAADCVGAVTLEGLLASLAPFDAEVIALRPSPGQAASAENIRQMLQDSPIVASHRESHHAVQDAYSLRCIPQVHGAARDALGFAREVVERELHSVVDNPVVLSDRGQLMTTGNFHGQALAYAADLLAMVCADVASISERRIARLVDATRSRGLPPFLTSDAGLNSGMMIAHYTSGSIVAQLRQQAAPFSVHSADVSAGQEDHVSMGFNAAMRTRRSVALLRHVLAIEAVCAAQGVDLRAPLKPARWSAAFIGSLRTHVAHLDADRVVSHDLDAADRWLRTGEWRQALTEGNRWPWK